MKYEGMGGPTPSKMDVEVNGVENEIARAADVVRSLMAFSESHYNRRLQELKLLADDIDPGGDVRVEYPAHWTNEYFKKLLTQLESMPLPTEKEELEKLKQRLK